MEMLHTVAEAVVLAFLVGAIVGGAVVAHFQLKSDVQNSEKKLQTVKVDIDNTNK